MKSEVQLLNESMINDWVNAKKTLAEQIKFPIWCQEMQKVVVFLLKEMVLFNMA